MSGDFSRGGSVSAHLGIERLEERDCPATLWMYATALGTHQALIVGQLSGGDVSGVEIRLSGAVSASLQTNLMGGFSFLTSQAALGNLTAVAVVNDQPISQEAYGLLTTNQPVITDFTATEQSGYWLFQGRVVDENPMGLT